MSAGIQRTKREQKKKNIKKNRLPPPMRFMNLSETRKYFVTAAWCSLSAYMILVRAWSRRRLHAACWTLEVNNAHEIDRSEWRLMCVCSRSGYSEQLHDFRSSNVDYISWYRTFISNRFANSLYSFWAGSFLDERTENTNKAMKYNAKWLRRIFEEKRDRESGKLINWSRTTNWHMKFNSIKSQQSNSAKRCRSVAMNPTKSGHIDENKKSILAFPIQIPFEIPLPDLLV